MPLPGENPTYTKIDDDTFYLSKTSSDQLNVTFIKETIAGLQDRIENLKSILRQASAVGVANAAAVDAP